MQDKYCKTCRFRLSSFLRTGYLGCPDCYESFEREIESGIIKIQGSAFHVGKKPKVSAQDKKLLSDYKKLLSEKENAGLEGRFSDMALIAEELDSLFSELKERGLL